jgi:hypothetical protein
MKDKVMFEGGNGPKGGSVGSPYSGLFRQIRLIPPFGGDGGERRREFKGYEIPMGDGEERPPGRISLP